MENSAPSPHLKCVEKKRPDEPSAREQVLANYDLMAVVFSHLGKGRQVKDALFKVALACKMFSGPALDCLWAHLDTYEDLLRLLPIQGEGFNGELSSTNFAAYCKRVRTLALRESAKMKWTPLFSRLAMKLEGKSALPGLNCLVIEHLSMTDLYFLPLFLLSPLQAIEFRRSSLSIQNIHTSVFSTIPTDVTSLRHLVLDHEDSSFQLQAEIPDAILQMTRLESLELRLPGTIMEPNFFMRLGNTFHSLRHLYVDVTFQHTEGTTPAFNNTQIAVRVCPSPSTPTGPSAFSALRFLHITLRERQTYHDGFFSLAVCDGFPPAMIPHVTSLTIIPPFAVNTRKATILTEMLSQTPKLRRLHLREEQRSWHSQPFFQFLPTIVALPPSLEKLIADGNIAKGVIFSVDQNSIKKLVAGHKSRNPKLREIVLPTQVSEATPGLDVLEYIAQEAVGLERLSFAIDSSLFSVETRCGYSYRPTQNHTLRYLAISDLRPDAKPFSLKEHSDIAQYLDALFPDLEKMEPYRDSQGFGARHEEHWVFIEHLRTVSRSGRMVVSQ